MPSSPLMPHSVWPSPPLSVGHPGPSPAPHPQDADRRLAACSATTCRWTVLAAIAAPVPRAQARGRPSACPLLRRRSDVRARADVSGRAGPPRALLSGVAAAPADQTAFMRPTVSTCAPSRFRPDRRNLRAAPESRPRPPATNPRSCASCSAPWVTTSRAISSWRRSSKSEGYLLRGACRGRRCDGQAAAGQADRMRPRTRAGEGSGDRVRKGSPNSGPRDIRGAVPRRGSFSAEKFQEKRAVRTILRPRRRPPPLKGCEP